MKMRQFSFGPWSQSEGAGLLATLLLVIGLPWTGAEAHKVSSVSLIAHLDSKEGTYLLDAAMEVVPSDDEILNEQIPPEEAARQFAEGYLVTMFDEVEQSPALEISIETASDENTPPELQRKQVLVKMSGNIPEDAAEFLLYLESTCPMAVVMVVIKDNKPSRRMQVILPGEYSRPVNIEPILEGDPFVEGAGGGGAMSTEKPDVKPEPEVVAPEREPSQILSGMRAFWFQSFLPLALTVSLFLLTTGRRAVFIQSAVFMIGMSLALALAAWGIWNCPAWVAPACGALLAIVSGESVFRHRFHGWRMAAFLGAGLGVGLLLSTSAEFRHLIPAGESVRTGSLIRFVLGAELALVVSGLIAAAFFLTMGRFDWYRKSVVTPVAVVLVAFGIFKCVESSL